MALVLCTLALGAAAPEFPELPVYQRALVVFGMSTAEAEAAAADYAAVRKCNDEFLEAVQARGVDAARLARAEPTAALAAANVARGVLGARLNVTVAAARECLLQRRACGQVMQAGCGTRTPFEFRAGSLGRLGQRVLYAMFLPTREGRALSLLGDTTAAQAATRPAPTGNPFQLLPMGGGGGGSNAFLDLVRASSQAFAQMTSTVLTPGQTGFPVAPRRQLDGFGVRALPGVLPTQALTTPGEADEKLARAFAADAPGLSDAQRAALARVLLRVDAAARQLGMDVFAELPPYMQQSLLLSAMAPDKSSLSDALGRIDFLQRTQLLTSLARRLDVSQAERAALLEYAAGDAGREDAVLAAVLDRHFPVELDAAEREALAAFFRAQPHFLRAVAVAYDWLAGHA